ncbi:hypothetical protein M422DRAFT_251495 [Sphaerobolus stellatus SS14]|uniref:Uncharacterized protein n=1 Tax=Sphaerobolus stellatus (strain SS14) TaxID=990650 RepID=A0A0C9VR68_SPHS4|nr:hypothetical protein M422DRAFT_251495 [Sphaerobolus stellatus SS14]
MEKVSAVANFPDEVPSRIIRNPANSTAAPFRVMIQPHQTPYHSQQLSSQSCINGIPTNNVTTFNPATDGARELELINQGIEAQEQEYTAELKRIQCAEHRSVTGNLTDESVESTPSTQVTSPTTRGKKRGRPPAQKSTTGRASRRLRRVPSNDSQPENNPADDTLPPTHSASGSNDVTIID